MGYLEFCGYLSPVFDGITNLIYDFGCFLMFQHIVIACSEQGIEVIIVGEHTHGSALCLCCQSLSAVEQQSPPSVWEGIFDKTKHVICATRVLQRRHIHQVTAQHNATMLFQPLVRIFKDKVILATDSFIAQYTNLLR